ncbi:MAG TPA: hypothetical protein VEQ59_06820 [Polyangiaceae bacterium]|nr:hypothetical protein [Polyangiaceae bacterium]
MGERLKLGVDYELRPVPDSVLRRLSIPAPSKGRAPSPAAAERPQRLGDSSAALELSCLLDTQPTASSAWLERMRASIEAEFADASAPLLHAALHGLDGAAARLRTEKAADRDRALADLDALLFALIKAKKP